MVGQSTRFTSVPFAAKKLIDEGRLGEIYFGETYWLRRRGIPTWGQFHMKEHSGAGPLYDLGVHNLDLLFWLMGNPAVKTATGVTYTKFGNRDEGLATSLADSGAPEAHHAADRESTSRIWRRASSGWRAGSPSLQDQLGGERPAAARPRFSAPKVASDRPFTRHKRDGTRPT